jgi:hypothetical protein
MDKERFQSRPTGKKDASSRAILTPHVTFTAALLHKFTPDSNYNHQSALAHLSQHPQRISFSQINYHYIIMKLIKLIVVYVIPPASVSALMLGDIRQIRKKKNP